jgi:hypothetical protein
VATAFVACTSGMLNQISELNTIPFNHGGESSAAECQLVPLPACKFKTVTQQEQVLESKYSIANVKASDRNVAGHASTAPRNPTLSERCRLR